MSYFVPVEQSSAVFRFFGFRILFCDAHLSFLNRPAFLLTLLIFLPLISYIRVSFYRRDEKAGSVVVSLSRCIPNDFSQEILF
jgi:hypothetical protein